MSATKPDGEQGVLTEDSPFLFACRDTLPCFTQCCRDVNIYLTPYDVLRLRRSLRVGSEEFLARHTRSFLTKTTSIPVVQLEMDPETLRCKFVGNAGCGVYENRPWACRLYPLDLGSRYGEYRTCVGKDRCLGLGEPDPQSVADWLETQEIHPYTEMETAFHAVVPSGFKPGAAMDAGLGKLLFLAYDLDRFAELLADKSFRKFYEIDDETLRRALDDDEKLLKLAFRYIRSRMEELYEVV